MADNQTPENIELGEFLEMAGKSLSDAQNSLLAGLDISTSMMLNNADIEVKVLIDSEKGRVVVKPISSEDLRVGSIDPGLLSTLRISYVPTFEEPVREAEVVETPKPQKESDKLVAEVLNRKDIQRLQATKGELQINTTFVSERQRWLVSVEDKTGKVLKEMILPDA